MDKYNKLTLDKIQRYLELWDKYIQEYDILEANIKHDISSEMYEIRREIENLFFGMSLNNMLAEQQSNIIVPK